MTPLSFSGDKFAPLFELLQAFEVGTDAVLIPVPPASTEDEDKQAKWLRTATYRYGLGIAKLNGTAQPAESKPQNRFQALDFTPANLFVLFLPRTEGDGQDDRLKQFGRQVAAAFCSPWFLFSEGGKPTVFFPTSEGKWAQLCSRSNFRGNALLAARAEGTAESGVPFTFTGISNFSGVEKKPGIPENFVVAGFDPAGKAVERWQDFVV